MGRVFIKIKDKYFIWSSVVDAPVSKGMDLDETKIMQDAGQCQVFWEGPLDEMIAANRAGKNEETLTADEIYERFYTEIINRLKSKKESLVTGVSDTGEVKNDN